jgi:hypothetical protein
MGGCGCNHDHGDEEDAHEGAHHHGCGCH